MQVATAPERTDSCDYRPCKDRAMDGVFVNVERRGGGPHACPCCGYLTLDDRAGYEICPVCSWEDDGQDDHDADEVRGGPNYGLSLTAARSGCRPNPA